MLQKGFTLIEVMIIVSIVGILAAVVIPAYSNYKACKINSSECRKNKQKKQQGNTDYQSYQESSASEDCRYGVKYLISPTAITPMVDTTGKPLQC